ncbi:hypothetical protein AB0H76_33585 [Nocardia sp. NPDC050712]|uniref:hypothetical protein n=1 Tax=Nocardia sp. NPDC050712 TaxID=3155518 RepID=UPI0033F21388
MVDEQGFPDHERTTRSHAGETLEDARNWPGIILVMLGIVGLALTVTAAGYGFAGWAIIGGIATVLCLGIGAFVVYAEHRRVRKHETLSSDDGGH